MLNRLLCKFERFSWMSRPQEVGSKIEREIFSDVPRCNEISVYA